jgi:hypothetical protein
VFDGPVECGPEGGDLSKDSVRRHSFPSSSLTVSAWRKLSRFKLPNVILDPGGGILEAIERHHLTSAISKVAIEDVAYGRFRWRLRRFTTGDELGEPLSRERLIPLPS